MPHCTFACYKTNQSKCEHVNNKNLKQWSEDEIASTVVKQNAIKGKNVPKERTEQQNSLIMRTLKEKTKSIKSLVQRNCTLENFSTHVSKFRYLHGVSFQLFLRLSLTISLLFTILVFCHFVCTRVCVCVCVSLILSSYRK